MAIDKLQEDDSIRLLKMSSLIETPPYGGVEMDPVLNGVFKIRTLYTPEELLFKCNQIEQCAGRCRNVHWGPRTLDLDILFYDELVLHSDILQIPHLDIRNRSFVLEPLNEIDPGFVHPIYKQTIHDLLLALKEKEANVR